MNTVMALALVLYLGWVAWGSRRTAQPRTLVLVSLAVVVLLAPLVLWTLQEVQMSAHLMSPTYFYLWPLAAVIGALLALILRRNFAFSWPLLGIAPCGLGAYGVVLLLFVLGVNPPLDVAP